MEFIDDGRLAKSSRDLYNRKLAQFIGFLPATRQSIDFIVDNPGLAVEALHKEKSISQSATNRHLFYSAVVAYLLHVPAGQRRAARIKQKWLEIQKANWEDHRAADMEELSDKAKAVVAAVKWKDVVAMRDKLPLGSDERLLLALYTYLPPVRADYFEVVINPPKSLIEKTKRNYLVLRDDGSGLLVLRNFKTAARYKEIRHELEGELLQEIHASLELNPRRFLFVMATDPKEAPSRDGFSKWANRVLKDLFKVPLTLTSLRHLFISTLDFTHMRAADLERVARMMGHGIAIQKEYQWLESGD
uniref:Tyr recombinase domain-containing protein n=1 Tax=viral metagenome TaxID=1070528 RepID=A0A6C0DRL5_9ZZZZ